MTVSHRLAPFGSSIFAQMTHLATKHNAINLSQGFPDFDGPHHIKQAAIDAINAGHSQYAPSAGLPALTQAIATRFLESTGIAVDPADQITVTAGCTEAIASSLLGLLNPGDQVILFEPYYDSYPACAALAGATHHAVTLHAPDFTFDPAELRAACAPGARALILNTPHNPTGRVFSRAELQIVADLCIERNLICLADEVYERLVYEPAAAPHLSIASIPGMANRTITLSSLGKSFGLTGWKIGWAVASPDLTRAVRAAHQFLTFAVNTPMQHAAVAALASPQSYFDSLGADYRAKRDHLAAGLRSAGFTLRDPQGAYFILADFRPVAERLDLPDDDFAFCHALIQRAGVAAIPPSAFYDNKHFGRHLVRFAFCKKTETLSAALTRLAAL